MVFGIDDAIGIASLGASLFGGKKDKAAKEVSGFDALPKAVQDAWLNTYLPKAMNYAQQDYQSIPMARVSAPSSVFDSLGLYDLQKYSDSLGGLFSPMAGRAAAPAAAPSTLPNSAMGQIYLNSLNPGAKAQWQGGMGGAQLSPDDMALLGNISGMSGQAKPSAGPDYGNANASPFGMLNQLLQDPKNLSQLFSGINTANLNPALARFANGL